MKPTLLLITTLLAGATAAQQPLPVIKASSPNIAINDGGFYDAGAWTLSPKVRPDVYTADRTRQTKWVTFYTDIDSIRVKVEPGTRFNFVILYNGKDSCFTQIASAIPPQTPNTAAVTATDTIPFTVTAHSAIHAKALVNNKDTLNLHFDVGSFDFRFLRNIKTRIGKVNTLQMGTRTWNNPDVLATGNTAREMDGRFGWNLFEGKTVEIDYDHNRLLIHSQSPAHTKGYQRLKLDFIRSFVCVKGKFQLDNKDYEGSFLLDTGSDQAVILDSNWAGSRAAFGTLPLIRTAVLTDPRGVKYESRIVKAPRFALGKSTLHDVPAYILAGKSPVGFEINYLGNDLLKRFNTILDFKNDYLYLKPNKLFSGAWKERA
ncbi:hypothetical protein HNQ91_002815 [Filimonas zeae]|uniref:Peptidase A2 domain-containing protein n=1 Tax=Filimonas zeae TaxID=1737353 RepID=A0A917IYP7_9BACT|nr:hypothetical protein [Filimonas zeae]MDR6339750.1 hypothetical protein [Filimonas zeae]GGH69466.1 hypothetical protein GCM10011379_26800 [Filimonas zeae]